jgi:hypothetical protein
MAFLLQVGDPVVFRLTKYSTEPGPRARDITPAVHGETYRYVVDKYWSVSAVTADDQLVLITRRGKTHTVRRDDPRLRKAYWWERWLYGRRFPEVGKLTAPADGAAAQSHSSLPVPRSIVPLPGTSSGLNPGADRSSAGASLDGSGRFRQAASPES